MAPSRCIALAFQIPQAMHMSNGDGIAALIVEKADAMGIAGARMRSIAISRKFAVNETGCLADDRIGSAHEGCQSEFRVQARVTVEEIASRDGEEEGIISRQSSFQLLEKIGTLRKLDSVIAINQPFGLCVVRADHFLQAQNIRLDIDEIGYQWLMQPPAPCIQRNDTHIPHLS